MPIHDDKLPFAFPELEEFQRSALENPEIPLTDVRALREAFDIYEGMTTEKVTRETALSIPAVQACVDRVAGAISQLPIGVFRRKPDGSREAVDDHPLAEWFRGSLNSDYLTLAQWLRATVADMMLDGRSVSEIENHGHSREVWRIPMRGRKIKLSGRRRVYEFEGRSLSGRQVFDFILYPGNEPGSAINIVKKHADTFGLALAATRYAAKQFDGGGIVAHVLKMPPMKSQAKDEQALREIQEAMRRVRKDPRPWAPLPHGFELEKVGADPQALSMIDTRRFQKDDIASLWGVPLSMIGDQSTPYNNVEQQALNFVLVCLVPIAEVLEQEITIKCFPHDPDYYVEFNFARLLRGDADTRSTFYDRALKTGWMNVNEVRALENMAPTKGGDIHSTQGANVPLEQVGAAYTKGAQPNPKEDPAQPGEGTNAQG